MSESWPGIVWLIVLLIGNAFFVGAEFAVISARRSQIEPRAAAGSRAAKTTLAAMEQVSLMLATSQLGITVCSLLILNVAEPAIHHMLEGPLGLTGLSPGMVYAVGFILALVLVTYLHVVFGEMVPKNLAFSVPTRAALLLAPPLVLVSRIVKPVIYTLNATANGILRLFRITPTDEAASTFTLEEVAGIVNQSQREGTISDGAGTLAGAFEFTDRTVGDVRLPLTDIILLPHRATPADVHQAVHTHGYSRYVVADAAGRPGTYLHMKDVMDLVGPDFDQPVPSSRLRSLPAVRDGDEVEDAMAILRRRGAHIGRAVGTDGRSTGVLFLEDVIEILVGEVEDAASELPPERLS